MIDKEKKCPCGYRGYMEEHHCEQTDCDKCCPLALQDTINRQQAEIENITEKFNCQQTVYADLSKIIKDKNAEIERLNNNISAMAITLSNSAKGTKVEAIKECLEWVLSLFPEDKHFTTISRFTINQRLKEMVGED